MKKFISVIIAAMLIIAAVSCKGNGGNTEKPDDPTVKPNEGSGKGGEIVIDEPVVTEEKGYFVKDGESEYKIVVPAEANGSEEFAASEIRQYIMMSTGFTLPVVSDEGLTYDENDKVISVGKTVYQKNADLKVDYEKLKTGGYFIKNFGDVYVIDSGSREGVLYGAYEFLNAFFGVEFLTHDDFYIPTTKDVKSFKIDYVTIPTFPIRDYYAYHVWFHSVSYGAKLKTNSTSFKSSDSVNGADNYKYYGYYYDYNGTRSFAAREGHSITALLSADAYVNGYTSSPRAYPSDADADMIKGIPIGYVRQHPEWYAYDPNFNRVGSIGRSQEEVCYSNGLDDDYRYVEQPSDVSFEDMSLPTKMIEIIKKMITEEPSEEAVYLMLGHGDFAARCKCEKCQAAYKKFGGFGGTTVVWGNEIIAQVKKWMKEENIDREVKFVMFAYSKSIEPPVVWDENGEPHAVSDRVVPDESMVIKMAYRNCVYHSLWDENCEQNEALRNIFKGWASLTKSFAIWDYTCVFDNYLWYLPNFGTIKDNYIYYKDIGVEHLLSQGMPSEYNCYEHSLHMWVSCKLMWNPYQDVNALIDKFNSLYFGKYADKVNEYRNVIENHFAFLDSSDEHGFHAATYNDLDFMSAEKYPVNMLLRMADVIQEAIDEVRTDADLDADGKENMEKKLRSVKITPQYMLLKLNLVQDETEKLEIAKDFFESVDILKLTYFEEGMIPSHSFEEMKKSYGL